MSTLLTRSPPPVSPPAITGGIESEADYQRVVRSLVAHDREQQQFPRMLLLSRAVRWGGLRLSSQLSNRRIPAPRSNALVPVQRALDDGRHLDAFVLAEALFMEGTLHFSMDLQALCSEALKGAGMDTLVGVLEGQLILLLTACPQVTELSFDDGTGVASEMTQQWLSALWSRTRKGENKAPKPQSQGEQQSPPSSDQSRSGGTSLEVAALGWAEKAQLDKALSCIARANAVDEVARLQHRLLQARVCLAARQYHLAKPLLESLLQLIDEHQLNRWRRLFAMQVWQESIHCFEHLSRQNRTTVAMANDRADELSLDLRIARLKERMVLTMPELAVRWLGSGADSSSGK